MPPRRNDAVAVKTTEILPVGPKVEYGNIAEGYASIAQHMGVFRGFDGVHQLADHQPEAPGRFQDERHRRPRLAERAVCDPLTAPGSRHAITAFEISPAHTEYLKKYVAKGDLQMIPAQGENCPGRFAVPAQLTKREQLAEHAPLAGNLKGHALLNSYQTQEVASLATELGLPPVSTDDYLNFTRARAHVHAVADASKITITPDLVFDKPAALDTYVGGGSRK